MPDSVFTASCVFKWLPVEREFQFIYRIINDQSLEPFGPSTKRPNSTWRQKPSNLILQNLQFHSKTQIGNSRIRATCTAAQDINFSFETAGPRTQQISCMMWGNIENNWKGNHEKTNSFLPLLMSVISQNFASSENTDQVIKTNT